MVEDIGLRSTRVRTADRTMLTIPNADFATMPLENFGARDRFRLATTLAVRYGTTPDQLRWVLVELRKLLLSHPKVSPNPARVRLVNISPSTLDIEVFAYVATRSEEEFLAVREDLLLRMMDVLAAAGTGLSYRRAYSLQDQRTDAERRQAAEARVAAWRAEGSPPPPDVPRARAAEPRTPDGPPAHSPGPRPKKP